MADRSSVLWLAGIAALFAVQVSPLWYPTPDSLRYLSTARSVALELRLAELGSPVLSFPPGYSLLLAPAFFSAPRPFLAISLLHLGLAILLIAGVERWARRSVGDGGLVTAMVGVNVSLWIHFRRPLSELAFMTAAVWTVQALNELATRGFPWRRALIASLAVAALPQIREVGVTFAAGFLCLAVLRSISLCGVALFLVSLASLGCFIVYDLMAAAQAPGPAATHLHGLLAPPMPHLDWAAEAIRLRVGEIGRLLVPGMALRPEPQAWLDRGMILHLPVLAVVGAGWLRLLRAGDVFAATLPFYTAVYVVWGFDAATRYMLPMLPLLAGSLWVALERLSSLRSILFRLLVAAHLVVAAGHWLVHDLPSARRCDAEWPAVDAIAAEWPSADAVASAAELTKCGKVMLGFRLDRPVAERAAAKPAVAMRDHPAPGRARSGAHRDL
ncbi:MAG: hypothetical protein ACREQQ_02345 [Candidatus Binatia bacterium]